MDFLYLLAYGEACDIPSHDSVNQMYLPTLGQMILVYTLVTLLKSLAFIDTKVRHHMLCFH